MAVRASFSAPAASAIPRTTSFFLHPPLVRLFGEHLQRVGLQLQVSQRVGSHVSELHVERVAVDQCGVLQPVSHGVALLRVLYDEGVGGVEVNAFYLRQAVVSVAEEEREVVGLLPFALDEVSVCERLGERLEHYVVGYEPRVSHFRDTFMRSESSHVVSWRVAPVVDGVMMSVVKAIFSLFWLNL